MPGEIFVIAPRLSAWALCCAALLVLGMADRDAHCAQALITAEVPPGKWKGVRLKNLPQSAKVTIQVESANGGIDLIFIHGDELKRFPAAVNPEFQGTVERKLSFTVVVARQGDYYVILDNRQNSEARKVKVLIRAEPAKKPGSPAPDPPASGTKKGEARI